MKKSALLRLAPFEASTPAKIRLALAAVRHVAGRMGRVA